MTFFSFEEILKSTPIPGFDNLTVSRILVDFVVLLLIYIGARFSTWSVQKLLNRGLKEIDEGRKFAINQISKYIIYAIAIGIMLDKLHIGSIIFTSFAGLFVGLGFGIQQTFNDLASGLILLLEGSIKVGNYIEFNQKLGKIIFIGVRYSIVRDRDGKEILVPNSKLIVDNVVNLSSNIMATRFCVRVGVIYGSDVDLVKRILLEAVCQHPDVIQDLSTLNEKEKNLVEQPLVYFQNFGDNSLVFDTFFWTRNIWDIDIVKSEVRFCVDRLFRENNLVIAFPQRDVHLKFDPQELEKIKFLLPLHKKN